MADCCSSVIHVLDVCIAVGQAVSLTTTGRLWERITMLRKYVDCFNYL